MNGRVNAIWRHDSDGWKVLAPTGFPDEATLHLLIEQAPQILPLAGSPRLTILGREVSVGSGYVDLLAIEPSGRIVIIEVKLARNAEARRAVVSQVLAYAAYLAGTAPSAFEQTVIGTHLRERGFGSLTDAVRKDDQEQSFDAVIFAEGLADSLSQGRFRIILALDEAPDELVRLVGYLQTISDRLVIDLVTVRAYQIDSSTVLVPQRVDPERQPEEPLTSTATRAATDKLTEGSTVFFANLDHAPAQSRDDLQKLGNWAESLEKRGLVKLYSYQGKGRWTLLPRLPGDGVGLVTIWNDNGAYLSLWRSVFERRAPKSLQRVEQLIAPMTVGQGTSIRRFGDDMLDTLTEAYREAAGQERLAVSPSGETIEPTDEKMMPRTLDSAPDKN